MGDQLERQIVAEADSVLGAVEQVRVRLAPAVDRDDGGDDQADRVATAAVAARQRQFARRPESGVDAVRSALEKALDLPRVDAEAGPRASAVVQADQAVDAGELGYPA